MKRVLLCGVLIAFLSNPAYGFKLSNRFIFASTQQADSVLMQEDDYLQKLSPFDIQSRLQKKTGNLTELKANIHDQIREWTNTEKFRMMTAIQKLEDILNQNQYHLPFPDQIIMIKSTMKDEGGAEGYTRLNAIVLKEAELNKTSGELLPLLIHELFHVLSRHDSLFRKDLYAIIGFHMMNEVYYPEQLRDLKISNPDASRKDNYIHIHAQGKESDCMLILYADKPYAGGSFFGYVQIGLVKLKNKGTIKTVDYVNGMPVIYDMDEVEDFFDQVGMNTNYTLDADEILAENFVFAITNKQGLPSPEIIEKIKGRLKQ